MKLNLLGLALAGVMLVASPASALVLSVSGGAPSVVPGNFNPSGFPGGLAAGDNITIGGTLSLSANTELTFEFLGKEAGFVNTFELSGIELFSTATAAVNDATTSLVNAGAVPFSFKTTNGGGLTANNGGIAPAGLSIAFADLGNDAFLALFGDGGGDVDYDDMVVKISVSQVPLPAAVWLLLSAVMGLVSFSTIRRRGSQTA
jgi:hypothetical protein